MSWDYGTTAATRLNDWLDPSGTAGNTIDGWDPNAQIPIVTTTSATGVSVTAGTMNGTVNPNGLATTYHFEWGTTTSYGNNTTTLSAGSGSATLPESANITGLTAGTTYHFRLDATNLLKKT